PPPLRYERQRGVDGVLLGGGAEFLRGQRQGLVVQIDHRLHVYNSMPQAILSATFRAIALRPPLRQHANIGVAPRAAPSSRPRRSCPCARLRARSASAPPAVRSAPVTTASFFVAGAGLRCSSLSARGQVRGGRR